MNSILRTIIIDDEEKAINNLQSLLKQHPQIKIVAFITRSENALETIDKFEPDLLFLDIDMPGKSGIEIAGELYHEDCKPEIIFVTAFNEFAIEAIRNAAFDYLLKPVKQVELTAAIGRLMMKQLQQNRGQQIRRLMDGVSGKGKLKISTTGGFTLINPSDILYIQADWNYTEIFFDGEKKELVTVNIGSLEEMLPPLLFFRINRSVIINFAYLVKVSRKNRLAYLVKDGKEYTFKIPLLNIRKLERILES